MLVKEPGKDSSWKYAKTKTGHSYTIDGKYQRPSRISAGKENGSTIKAVKLTTVVGTILRQEKFLVSSSFAMALSYLTLSWRNPLIRLIGRPLI